MLLTSFRQQALAADFTLADLIEAQVTGRKCASFYRDREQYSALSAALCPCRRLQSSARRQCCSAFR